jgi:hypothetical protein
MTPELESLTLQWFRKDQEMTTARAEIMDAQAKFSALEHDQENIRDRIDDLIRGNGIQGLFVDGQHIVIVPPPTNDHGIRIEVVDFQEPLREEKHELLTRPSREGQ